MRCSRWLESGLVTGVRDKKIAVRSEVVMLAFVGGKVITITKGTIEEGTVLVKDGKITAVGAELDIPAGAEEVDCRGKVVMPGLIDAHAHVGIFEEGINFEGDDGNEMTDPITPHLRTIDAINPEDQGFRDALEGGVTTVFIPPGSANVIGGTGVVVKVKGNTIDDMVVRQDAGLKIAFGENPKRVYHNKNRMPSTRMATAALLREAIVKAINYAKKTEKAIQDGEYPERDLKWETVLRVIRKEMPLRAHAHRADDIITAIRIAKEYNLPLCIEHCTEGHKIREKLKEQNIPVVIGPGLSNRSKVELRDLTFKTPALLHEAGVKFALMTDHPVVPIKYLAICAGLAVKEGLEEEEALKAITINAAEILGLGDRIGSLEPGKDADIIVLSGHPLELRTVVEKVFIEGTPVYIGSKE